MNSTLTVAAMGLILALPACAQRPVSAATNGRLDCPEQSGSLDRIEAAQDGRSCRYRMADGAEVELRLVDVVGDARALSLEDDHVRGITMAFGIRNVPDRDLALREMVRVTQPGGAVSILELAEPTEGPFAALARAHVHHIVPRIGRLVAGTEAYRYLQESIAAFPSPEDFREQMERAGLVEVTATAQTFATATLYTGRVPTKD